MTLAPHPVCRSYWVGHHMHWIHWKRVRETTPVRGRLVRLDGEDLVLATEDGQTLRWQPRKRHSR